MITKDELQELFASTETYRIERTVSTTDKDKFGEAVCAFANDMPDSGKPGYLLIGVRNDGSLNGLRLPMSFCRSLPRSALTATYCLYRPSQSIRFLSQTVM
jgi:predicted HTH transcriptional regulator